MSFQRFIAPRRPGRPSEGKRIRMNAGGASMSVDLQRELCDGYDLACNYETGQIAVIVGGPYKADRNNHRQLACAMESFSCAIGDSFLCDGTIWPLNVSGAMEPAFVFDVRPFLERENELQEDSNA